MAYPTNQIEPAPGDTGANADVAEFGIRAGLRNQCPLKDLEVRPLSSAPVRRKSQSGRQSSAKRLLAGSTPVFASYARPLKGKSLDGNDLFESGERVAHAGVMKLANIVVSKATVLNRT